MFINLKNFTVMLSPFTIACDVYSVTIQRRSYLTWQFLTTYAPGIS